MRQTAMEFGQPLCKAAEPIDWSKIPGCVRKDMERMLSELRRAKTMPWDQRKLSMWRIIVPQTTRWLSNDERERICAEFDAEIARLTAPAAG
jgi:hypothetical protein